ncbi:MAG: 16S rRNA (adenine(1518)-N(6)/adenine(1519)-N(6))-dimethyltransferase RsmA, partial [Nitriliruptorales bacterium]
MDPGERGHDLLTPADVRRLLVSHGIAPRKAAGQNFVVDANTVRKIVRDAGVEPHDVVLEVGPGLGSLTLALAEAAARVAAVEVDAGLVAALAEVLEGVTNVEVVHADALRTDLGDVVGGGPARFIANLPYNVATPLVLDVLANEAFTDLFVMVQREVGQRWAADVGDELYGAVSVKIALAARAEIAAQVPRTVFHPVPKVDSVTVRIRRRPDAPSRDERARIARVVDAAFGQRRKTLRNSLRAVAEP